MAASWWNAWKMWRHAPSRRLSNFWDEGAPATRARIYRGWGTQLASLDHAVRADLGFQWKHILTGGEGVVISFLGANQYRHFKML